jgi:hypothetical protein
MPTLSLRVSRTDTGRRLMIAALLLAALTLLQPVGRVAAQEGPTEEGWNREIFATLCDGSTASPYAPDPGCEPAEGVTIIVTDESGQDVIGTCTTSSPSSAEGAASCFVVVPYGTLVLMSQDPATIPADYAPLTPTQTFMAPPEGGPIGALETNLFVNVPVAQAEPEPTAPPAADEPPTTEPPADGGDDDDVTETGGTVALPDTGAGVARNDGPLSDATGAALLALAGAGAVAYGRQRRCAA